jgi:hypothetical protein
MVFFLGTKVFLRNFLGTKVGISHNLETIKRTPFVQVYRDGYVF